jgi:glycerol uptake facilitator-like aquaporin
LMTEISKPLSLQLPRKYRVPGIVLTVFGAALLIARFAYGFKPAWLDTNTFAVYSVYIEAKYFEIIGNQMIEEIGGVSLFSGMLMIALAKEKTEGPETDRLRLRAFVFSFYLSFGYLLFSLLLLYGFGYVIAMLLFPVFLLASYIIVFLLLMKKWKAQNL